MIGKALKYMRKNKKLKQDVLAKEIGICTSNKEGINASELNNLSEKELVKYANKYSVFQRLTFHRYHLALLFPI